MRLLFFAFTLFLAVGLFAEENPVEINSKFISNLRKTASIIRDDICDGLLKGEILAKGTVVAIDKVKRFGQSGVIVVKDSLSKKKYGIDLEYHIYYSNLDMPLIVGEKFEFKAMMVMFIPTNMKRDSYIFDLIFLNGSMVID